MKTTRIGIIEPEPGDRFTFRRIVVNWHRGHVLHTIASAVLEDTAPPEKVVHVLHELAHRIERTCMGVPQVPEVFYPSRTWEQFVADVNRLDRISKDGQLPMRHDPSLPAPGGPPTVPLFEFFGYKVFLR